MVYERGHKNLYEPVIVHFAVRFSGYFSVFDDNIFMHFDKHIPIMKCSHRQHVLAQWQTLCYARTAAEIPQHIESGLWSFAGVTFILNRS